MTKWKNLPWMLFTAIGWTLVALLWIILRSGSDAVGAVLNSAIAVLFWAAWLIPKLKRAE